jgi:hypothetical protein
VGFSSFIGFEGVDVMVLMGMFILMAVVLPALFYLAVLLMVSSCSRFNVSVLLAWEIERLITKSCKLVRKVLYVVKATLAPTWALLTLMFFVFAYYTFLSWAEGKVAYSNNVGWALQNFGQIKKKYELSFLVSSVCWSTLPFLYFASKLG